MCGIAGFVNYAGRYSPGQVRDLTLAMRDALTHRGPDDAGLWLSPDGLLALGHRRLSIVDLRPEGRQPLGNEDESVIVTFNGEIYNYRDLTTDLIAQGHRFATRTDTEVLCHLFENEPEQAIPRLEGMFALGAWRSRDKELVLARDPFGKKPLYYVHGPGYFAFASELRSLAHLPGMDGAIDPVGLQQYLLLQYTHAPRTIFRHCRKLEPGTLLRLQVRQGQLLAGPPRRFFEFQPNEPSPRKTVTEAEALDQLADLSNRAVRDRLMGDVPLGAFLSGGVDSSLVAALMVRELGIRPRTFSIGFTDSPESEHDAARFVADHLGTDHHEEMVDPSAIDLLPELAGALDEPNGDSSCLPVYLLSRFTRRHVTVALSGDGGDELFGGYQRYADTLQEAQHPPRLYWALRFRRWWRPADAYLLRALPGLPEREALALVGSFLPEVDGMLRDWKEGLNDAKVPLIHRMRRLDVASYLPGAVLAKVDRMSMRFALEVRCPLLDVRLGRWVQQLPAPWCHDGRRGKVLLKKLAERYLPPDFLNRPKQGFGLPARAWSREKILARAHDLLLDPAARLSGHVDRQALKRFLERQTKGFSVYQVWGLLLLEEWLRQIANPMRQAPPFRRAA